MSAVVTGWGNLQSGGSSPDRLQAVSVSILSNHECNVYYSDEWCMNDYCSITDSMLCAGEAGKDSCQGD